MIGATLLPESLTNWKLPTFGLGLILPGPTPSFGPAPKPSFGCTIAGLIFGEIGPPTFLSDFGTPAGRPTGPILLLTRGCATTRRETERCTFTRGALRITGARLTEIVRRCAAEI